MANVHTVDLVNRILPNVGDTISVEDYRANSKNSDMLPNNRPAASVVHLIQV